MAGCSSCSGSCGSCGGCPAGGSLLLGPDEIAVLNTLSQIPFLPIARRADSMTPVYLEDDAHTVAEYGVLLELLEKKGLISLDYDRPLKGFDDSAYRAYPIRGSMALTARGQSVVELLDRQGAGADD